MIARDEERHLPDCLKSLEGIVDEVVIVDTGSVDGTVEIARAYGARIFHHEWDNSFANARNAGLDQARSRWILYIDADERLRPISRSSVEELLENAQEVGFQVYLHQLPGYTPTLDYRLWRNDPRVRFWGDMHEKIIYGLVRVGEADGRSIDICDLILDHVGYQGDQRRKYERNLPLLEAQVAIEPSNIFNWRHLSQVLIGCGRLEEGERALEQAVDLAREVWNEHGGAAWGDLVRLRHERGTDVRELLAEGRTRWPRNWGLVWLEGQLHLEAGRYEPAIDCFRMLLEVNLDTIPFDGVGFDERIFGELAHEARGLALFRTGRFGEAAEAYAAAQRHAPNSHEYRVKRLLAQSRAEQQGHWRAG
jgi:glycosyltransferase involved in cell wall biosynthesis